MTRDEALRTLAEIQHALVARRQARRLGFDREALAARIARGEWVEETPRVLRRTGAPFTRLQTLMLAVLDGPRGSFLSFDSAGELWGVPGFAAGPPEVTYARSVFQRPTAGRVHRPMLLLPHHLTTVDGIPVSTLPKTIFDLAPRMHEERLEVVIDRIIAKSPGVLDGLHALLPELARRGRPGIAVMRRQLAKRPPGYVPVQTGLEMRFERLVGVAMRRQVDLGGHEWIGRVDFVDDLSIIYEVDSTLHHTSLGDRARDEARDRGLIAAGFLKVVRIAEEDVWYHPDRVRKAVHDARAEIRARRGNPA